MIIQLDASEITIQKWSCE